MRYDAYTETLNHIVAKLPNAVLEIASGEGDGPGTVETYTGKRTVRAIKARISRESCNGDRYCYLLVDGERL